MNLSALIEEFIDLKLQGPPPSSDWISITAAYEAQARYEARLQELREQIDAGGAKS